MKKVDAVRGAVGVDRNSRECIVSQTEAMMRRLIEKNGWGEDDLVSVQFTVTADLTAANPATAFRRLGYERTPLFCSLEPSFEGAMQGVVRVLVTAYSEDSRGGVPVYMGGAEKLRPDLAEENGGSVDKSGDTADSSEPGSFIESGEIGSEPS